MNVTNILMNYDYLKFPEAENAVYVLICRKGNATIPFYVGESGDFQRRMADYRRADFQAPTDFKGGEAIKYFKSQGCEMDVAICKDIHDREAEEDRVIKLLKKQGYKLLNDLRGYDRKKANRDLERTKIQQFCGQVLKTLNGIIDS